MTDDKTRLDHALAALDVLEHFPAESDAERAFAAMEAFDGFELTAAPASIRDAIESLGLRHNALARRYPPESPDAFPGIGPDDARDLLTHLRQTAELIRNVETERILERLRHDGGVLPEAEVMEMRRHRNWFIPHLLRECHDQLSKLKQLEDADALLPDDQYSNLPFYAWFLFSEWHVAESVSFVLEALRLPGQGSDELFGDALHELAPRYFAQFLFEDLDKIDSIVSAPEIDLYVRWSVANSYKFLVRDERISVDDAVVRLDHLFQETKVTRDEGSPHRDHCYELSAAILETIHSIGGTSRSAISADPTSWNFVDESIFDIASVVAASGASADREAIDRLRRLPPTRIEDCLEELRDWAAFQPTPAPPMPASQPAEQPRRPAPWPLVNPLPSAAEVPIRRGERVPRNAPCPCGSGKKYKQCCLRIER